MKFNMKKYMNEHPCFQRVETPSNLHELRETGKLVNDKLWRGWSRDKDGEHENFVEVENQFYKCKEGCDSHPFRRTNENGHIQFFEWEDGSGWWDEEKTLEHNRPWILWPEFSWFD